MDRRLSHLLTATLLATLATAEIRAQETPRPPKPRPDAAAPESGEPQDRPGRGLRPGAPQQRPERLERLRNPEERRRALEKLPPEERQRLRENLGRWEKLEKEEREALRDVAERRREMRSREVDEAVRKSGLELTKDEREVFALRYTQERRKIEQELRDEMEKRRRVLIDGVIEQLRDEFADRPAEGQPAPKAPDVPERPDPAVE